jgi:hypothetical protein
VAVLRQLAHERQPVEPRPAHHQHSHRHLLALSGVSDTPGSTRCRR